MQGSPFFSCKVVCTYGQRGRACGETESPVEC